MDVHLEFDEQISGPLEQDENPFANDRADIGCVCALRPFASSRMTWTFYRFRYQLISVQKGNPCIFPMLLYRPVRLFGHLMICAGKDGLITTAIPVAAGSVCSIGLRQIPLWIFSRNSPSRDHTLRVFDGLSKVKQTQQRLTQTHY